MSDNEDKKQADEIGEKDLDSVTGGATQNRYDPNVCPGRRRAEQSCWGFLGTIWCDHYRRKYNRDKSDSFLSIFDVECVMGSFRYEEERPIDPSY